MSAELPEGLEHDADKHVFNLPAPDDGAVVRYRTVSPEVLDLYSTFVPTELRGKGIAGKLVKLVLRYAQDNQLKVVPSCWYVKGYIERHAEFQDLVAG